MSFRYTKLRYALAAWRFVRDERRGQRYSKIKCALESAFEELWIIAVCSRIAAMQLMADGSHN